MADRGHAGGADVIDELFYAGFISKINNSRKDPCDLLLDAIDAQLGQLQVQPRKCQTISREIGGKDADPLIWSQSLSKDTGFGSTTQTNDTPLSCLDLIHTPKMDHTSESSTRLLERDMGENVSQREQVIWRLRRLLGDACNEGGLAGDSLPPADSICTEDFGRRFRDEMVESEFDHFASNMQRLDKKEVTERQVTPGFDDCLSEQKGQSILNVRTLSSCGVNTSWSETTAAEKRNKPQRPGCDGSSQRFSNENVQNRSPKAQLKRRKTYRLVCSSGDGDQDTDEEVNPWRRQSRTERTPEKTQSDWARMKERLSTIRQCEEEEMMLQKKKAQIKDVNLFLSELQQRRTHALQELKRLTEETAKMEKQKRTLEFVLRDNGARRDSISCQRNEQRRQRESCILQPSGVTPALEREETEPLAEQRRARETRESKRVREPEVQTGEELQTVTEADSSPRDTCASLEEKLEQRKEELEAVELQVGKLQRELGECKVREGTQQQMLAQKELQMLDLHEELGASQAERGGLRGELQHMEVPQCKALEEAQEKSRGVVLKEETKMLSGSLEQQQNRDEQPNGLQKSHRAVLRPEQTEADELRRMREDSEGSNNQRTAELEQQLRRWALELGAECRHLHLLVEQSGAQQSAHSPTATEALTHLRTLREQLKHLIDHLQLELHSQKETTEQLRKEMERQLSVQRQQLRTDKDRALDSLKERLIQEHIEELSSLNWARPCEGRAEVGGMAACLRRQLKAKDLELRQVQRSMAQWKERTAARLACKFEAELTAELERYKTKLLKGRKPSKPREESRRVPMKAEAEMTHSADKAWKSVCSPSLRVVDGAASSDVASFKLLRHLQSRVKQLRVETQACSCSPSPPESVSLDLSGSYIATITRGQDGGIQRHSSTSAVRSWETSLCACRTHQ
uniref:trichohyalin isoform X5 n=1 Tax=Gasterosteus aculeatus aculeatus TaxID=481459 RepID=UPI001A97F569|nr:trichohyalin isoform X5 [Gasterosteus aculeatus aculeatus]